MKAIVIGPSPFDPTGYGAHCRGLTAALWSALGKGNVKLDVPLPDGWEKLADDCIMDCVFTNPKVREAVHVCVQPPPLWPIAASFRPKAVIGCLVFEGDRIPKQWADNCNDSRIAQVWVPSKHVYDAAIRSGVEEDKLRIIPHGVTMHSSRAGRHFPTSRATSSRSCGIRAGRKERTTVAGLIWS